MYIIAAYLVIALSVLVLAKKTVQLEKEAERNQLIQSYMVTLQGFYQTIQSQIDMTRKFRHDLAKHIQTLEALMEEQNGSELREYADSLKQEYRQVENKGESESEVVNAILSMKERQCREKNIPFCINIEEKGYALVRDIDMVGLLVNLLDNAMEACEKLEKEERNISVEIRRHHAMLMLIVENSCRQDAPVKKGIFRTTKKNRVLHGYGLRSVRQTVKNYGGQFESGMHGNNFYVKILIALVI